MPLRVLCVCMCNYVYVNLAKVTVYDERYFRPIFIETSGPRLSFYFSHDLFPSIPTPLGSYEVTSIMKVEGQLKYSVISKTASLFNAC